MPAEERHFHHIARPAVLQRAAYFLRLEVMARSVPMLLFRGISCMDNWIAVSVSLEGQGYIYGKRGGYPFRFLLVEYKYRT